jgi:D-tyrosyl-tRNA(Tyr) deacylase
VFESPFDSIFFKVLIQRVSFAEVKVQNSSRGKIQKGLFILLGFGHKLRSSELSKIQVQELLKAFEKVFKKTADKIFFLRVFRDESLKMSKNILNTLGGIYLVSQFTLFSNCKKGNRPSFTNALPQEFAKPMYDAFVNEMKKKENQSFPICTGVFGEDMEIGLSLDGPVTIELLANSHGFISGH